MLIPLPATLPTARQVSPIVEDVRARGDAAVREYTAKFDRVQMEAVCTPIEVRRCSPRATVDPGCAGMPPSGCWQGRGSAFGHCTA